MEAITPAWIAGTLIAALVGVCGWMIRVWLGSIKTEMIARDKRMDRIEEEAAENKTQVAVLKANLEHIRVTADSVAADVKTLLTRDAKTG